LNGNRSTDLNASPRTLPIALVGLLVLLLAVLAALSGGATRTVAATGDTVTISGVAYAFFGIDDHAPGAVVRVDEFPELSAPVAIDGSYSIEVPDDENVTLYIDPPATYVKTYLQTFHTSGQDIDKAHFQMPREWHYNAFSALLEIPRDRDGELEDCVIVSTFSIHEARDATTFDPGFKDVYPHGLPGSTATITPRLGNTKGATFFDFEPLILPNPERTDSSEDGGVLWTEVPPGYYWLEPDHPTERLAPFLAHCENGRVINASPPWGFYELKPGQEPDPAVMASAPDTSVEARVARRATALRRGRSRSVKLDLIAGEPLTARLVVKRGSRVLGASKSLSLRAGKRTLSAKLKRGASAGRSTATVTLSDEAGNSLSASRTVRIPR
jgi:hypothetical protein